MPRAHNATKHQGLLAGFMHHLCVMSARTGPDARPPRTSASNGGTAVQRCADPVVRGLLTRRPRRGRGRRSAGLFQVQPVDLLRPAPPPTTPGRLGHADRRVSTAMAVIERSFGGAVPPRLVRSEQHPVGILSLPGVTRPRVSGTLSLSGRLGLAVPGSRGGHSARRPAVFDGQWCPAGADFLTSQPRSGLESDNGPSRSRGAGPEHPVESEPLITATSCDASLKMRTVSASWMGQLGERLAWAWLSVAAEAIGDAFEGVSRSAAWSSDDGQGRRTTLVIRTAHCWQRRGRRRGPR